MQRNRVLFAILLAGFFLRLIVLINAPVDYEVMGGGDARWYIANGVALLSGIRTGVVMDLTVDMSVLPTAPLYLLFVGFFVRLLPYEIALTVIRLMQIAMSLATCYFAYDIIRRLTDDERAGWVAAALLAFAPAIIREASDIVTETSYIFYIIGGIWAFVRAVNVPLNRRWLILCGLLLALATLTRAVSLLFPVGLAGLMVLIHLRKNWRQGFVSALLLLTVYAALVSTWTIYNAVVYDRFIIGSSQLMPTIWRGAVEGDSSPEANDELLGTDTYTEQTAEVVTSDPTGYLRRRIIELVQAYLQPHGTIGLGGDSLKAMAQTWVQSGFSLDGLWTLITGEGFFPKLLIYIWHFGGLLLGFVGMWLTRQRWQISLALIGFIVYTTLLHLVLLALPRYIFPAMICYWMFAAVTLVQLWDRGYKSVKKDEPQRHREHKEML